MLKAYYNLRQNAGYPLKCGQSFFKGEKGKKGEMFNIAASEAFLDV